MRELDARLAATTAAELREAWVDDGRGAVPAPPPDLLRRMLAYGEQEKRIGRLLASRLREQRMLASGAPGSARVGPGSGARLVRQWRGRTISVDVEEDGYRYEGRAYRSLSAIACEVTGAKWSGPRFLGWRPVARPATVRGAVRCAIYTRKSTEDGLEQDYNSLDAQRDACAAYIASQGHEGWIELSDGYDDGGVSGGTMERPALRRLLDDVACGRVDVIVIYKVDRLTRSLADFARIVDALDAAQASFVRGDGRALPRQDRRVQAQGAVDGRPGAARL